MERSKLELMLLHILNERSPNGKPWKSITLPGIGQFTHFDVLDEIQKVRHPIRWWEFWKQ